MTRASCRRVASEPRSGRGGAPSATTQHGATDGVVCAQDPARMSPEARMAELGRILALGFRRVLQNRSIPLDDRPQSERACEPVVNSREKPTEGIA